MSTGNQAISIFSRASIAALRSTLSCFLFLAALSASKESESHISLQSILAPYFELLFLFPHLLLQRQRALPSAPHPTIPHKHMPNKSNNQKPSLTLHLYLLLNLLLLLAPDRMRHLLLHLPLLLLAQRRIGPTRRQQTRPRTPPGICLGNARAEAGLRDLFGAVFPGARQVSDLAVARDGVWVLDGRHFFGGCFCFILLWARNGTGSRIGFVKGGFEKFESREFELLGGRGAQNWVESSRRQVGERNQMGCCIAMSLRDWKI